MKRILTGLLLTSAMTTAAMAEMKSNVVVGLGAGMQNFRTYAQQNYNNSGTMNNYSIAGHVPAAMVFLGYRASMGMFLGGLEVDALTPGTYQNKVAKSTEDFTSNKIRANWAFGASVLLGANVTDTAYAALRLGAEHRKYTLTTRLGSGNNQSTPSSFKYKALAFTPGILLGTGFAGCWDLSADYRIRLGRTKTVGEVRANYTQYKLKDTNHTFMLKLAYKFGI